MQLPRFLQRLADRFNAETGEGLRAGWQAAHDPAAGQGPGSPRQVAGRWLDSVGQRLDGLLAQDRVRPVPAGGLRKLGRAATFPARVYLATTQAFGYATAETVGWYDGHRARAAAVGGPRPYPEVTGSGDGRADGYTGSGGQPQPTYAARAAYGPSRAVGGSRTATASGTGRATTAGAALSPRHLSGPASPPVVSRLSFATRAQMAPRSRPAGDAAIGLPAAPVSKAIGSRRTR